jgi:hypothetical protein
MVEKRKLFTEAELRRLLKVISKPRDRAMFLVCDWRGLRASEVGRLQPPNWDHPARPAYGLPTPEYDMLESNVANYSDLAKLMAPRPFMVERGHNDVVAPDEWVAYDVCKSLQSTANLVGLSRADVARSSRTRASILRASPLRCSFRRSAA